MAEVDREHRVKLVVDEWGRVAIARAPRWRARTFFGQTLVNADALVAALGRFDTSTAMQTKWRWQNVAQLINNLHSLFLAREDKFVATPNFHVFEDVFRASQGALAENRVQYPAIGGSAPGIATLAGSASLHERRLVLTVANTHASEPFEAQIRIRGASVRSGKARMLHRGPTFGAQHVCPPSRRRTARGGMQTQWRLRYIPVSARVHHAVELELG